VFGNLSYAMGEFYRGIYKAAQVKELQKFVPSLKTSDVIKFVSVLFIVYRVRTDSTDYLGCLPIHLSISIFYFFISFFPLFSLWFHAID